MIENIVGGLIGKAMAGGAAKRDRANIDEMNRLNNQYFNTIYPMMKDNLERTEEDYLAMRETGPYTGDMFTPANERMLDTTDQMYNFGQDQYNIGRRLMDENAGFGQNTRDLYGNFTDLANRGTAMFDANQAGDPMADASAYAQANMSPIVQAMMRDDRRALTEQTLPSININASGSGNVNSSRAGMADAIANRAFDDRRADVSTDVFNSLRNAKLAEDAAKFGRGLDALSSAGSQFGNAGTVNRDMRSAYTLGADAAAGGLNTSFGAGTNNRRFDQEQMDADKGLFDYNTGYNYNLGKDFGGFLSGSTLPASANYALNAVDPRTAGYGGAMSGFGMGGGMGGMFGNMFDGIQHDIGNLPIFDGLFGGGSGFNINWGA